MTSSGSALLGLLEAAAGQVAELATPAGEVDGRTSASYIGIDRIDIHADDRAVSFLVANGVGVDSQTSGLHEVERDVIVVVDPIDGLVNYLRGIPWFGPCFCAVDAEGPVAAVISNLGTGTTYTASRDGGAFRNGTPIATSKYERLDQHASVHADYHLLALQQCRRLNFGATTHGMCLVADGSVDAYVDVRTAQYPAGYLGASLIIAEAGGLVVARHYQKLDYVVGDSSDRQVIAAGTRSVAQSLLEATSGPGGPRSVQGLLPPER